MNEAWGIFCCSGAKGFIGSTGEIAVQVITNLSWEQEKIAKNVTNQMTFIVRVM
jgi:hypothetical protein